MPKKPHFTEKPGFIGPRQPTLREALAWAGVRPPSENERESALLWRRRRKQLSQRR
jgi:hypothetical protein